MWFWRRRQPPAIPRAPPHVDGHGAGCATDADTRRAVGTRTAAEWGHRVRFATVDHMARHRTIAAELLTAVFPARPGATGAGGGSQSTTDRVTSPQDTGAEVVRVQSPLARRSSELVAHSHSMVPGGLLVTSSTTRLTSVTSLVMRVEILASTSYGTRVQSAVIASSEDTGRSTMGWP